MMQALDPGSGSPGGQIGPSAAPVTAIPATALVMPA
jgi:hypothetical protein